MKLKSAVVAVLVAISWQGCGPGGTSTGNPAVRVVSQAYAPGVASLQIPGLGWLVPSAVAAAGVSSFQFCVTKMKLEAGDGSPIQENGSGEFEAKLGLIDLGDGTSSVTWGDIQFPASALIKKIKIEVHHDKELCNLGEYSTFVNGQGLKKDLEFIFTFASPQQVSAGSTLTVALTNLVSALNLALQAGQLDDEHISDYLDGSVEDSCH